MADMSTIGAVVTSFNLAKDMAKAMVGLRDAQLMQAKVIELNTQIFDALDKALTAKQEHAALVERIRDLEKEIVGLKAWDTENENYELRNLAGASVVYAPKDSMKGGGRAHYLCANCYSDRKKSFLQQVGPVLHCARCSAKIMIR